MGRPSSYTAELAANICERLASGESLKAICRDEAMPDERSVRRWALNDVEGFAPRYAQAREIQAFSMADELLEIADDASNDWMVREGKTELNGEHVQRSRLRSDTRKWLLSKMLPKVYGDKITQEHTGADGGPIEVASIDRPPNETREQWTARRFKELERAANPLLSTPPAGSAD
jgi:hypothetical protein